MNGLPETDKQCTCGACFSSTTLAQWMAKASGLLLGHQGYLQTYAYPGYPHSGQTHRDSGRLLGACEAEI